MSGIARWARTLVVVAAAIVPLLIAQRTASAHFGQDKPTFGPTRPQRPGEGARGRVAVVTDAASGPIRLERSAEGDGFVGSFEIRNVGEGRLTVHRVGPMTTENRTRTPAGLGVKPAAGSGRDPSIAPGASRIYEVTWRVDQTRADQVFGHLVIESDGAAADAVEFDPPTLVGVVADRRGGPARRLLSFLAFTPLLLSLLALASRFTRALDDRVLRGLGGAIGVATFALAAWACAAFERGFGRGDGNDGLQLIERERLGGTIEYFVGVDGVSAAALPVVGLALATACLSTPSNQLRRFTALAGLLASGCLLLLVSQTLVLVVIAYALVGLTTALLALGATSDLGAARARVGTARGLAGPALVIVGALGAAAVTLFAHWLSRAVGSSHLLDGRETPVTYSLPDIAIAVGHAHGAAEVHTHGDASMQTLFVLAVLGFGVLFAIAPFHGWLADLAGEADAPCSALLLSITSLAGGYGVIRFGVFLLPEGARWGADLLSGLGIATMVFAGLRSLSEKDLRRIAGHLVTASGGAALVSLSSLTPQGVQGALALVYVRAVAAPLLLLCVGALVTRAGQVSIDRIGGIGRTAPKLSACLVLATLATAGFPGTAGAWATLLGMIGNIGRQPVVSIGFAAAMLVVLAASIRLLSPLFSDVPEALANSKHLEPHGGRVPDLWRSDAGWAAPLVVALVVLSVAPRILVGLTNQSVLDFVPLLDPPGPTQVARAEAVAKVRT